MYPTNPHNQPNRSSPLYQTHYPPPHPIYPAPPTPNHPSALANHHSTPPHPSTPHSHYSAPTSAHAITPALYNHYIRTPTILPWPTNTNTNPNSAPHQYPPTNHPPTSIPIDLPRQRATSFQAPNQGLYTVTRPGPQHASSNNAAPQGMPPHWEPQPYLPIRPSDPEWIISGKPPSHAMPLQLRPKKRVEVILKKPPTPPPNPKYGTPFSMRAASGTVKYGPPSPPEFICPPMPENRLCAVHGKMMWAYWAGRWSGLMDQESNGVCWEVGGWTSAELEAKKEKVDKDLRACCMTREALESYEAFWGVMKEVGKNI